MKDAYYFSHDSNASQDPKILAMRSVYGWEGYGWYWMLVEMMREQQDYRLNISGKYVFNAFAMQMHCTSDAAEKFIMDCINEFNLFDSDGSSFWSNSLLRRMSEKDEKSEKGRKAANARWGNTGLECKRNADALQTQCEPNAIKESKGKEKKVNTTTPISPSEKTDTDFNPEEIDSGRYQVFDSFEKEFGRLLSPTEAEMIAGWINDYGPDLVIHALKTAVINSRRNISYIRGILANWYTFGVKSVQDVEEIEKQRQDQKQKAAAEANNRASPAKQECEFYVPPDVIEELKAAGSG